MLHYNYYHKLNHIQPEAEDETVYASHVNTVTDICNTITDSEVIILGDYNLPNIVWQPSDVGNELIPTICSGNRESCVCDSFLASGLSQYNHVGNCCDNVLDLVFSSCMSLEVSTSDYPLVCVDQFHLTLVVSIPHL